MLKGQSYFGNGFSFGCTFLNIEKAGEFIVSSSAFLLLNH